MVLTGSKMSIPAYRQRPPINSGERQLWRSIYRKDVPPIYMTVSDCLQVDTQLGTSCNFEGTPEQGSSPVFKTLQQLVPLLVLLIQGCVFVPITTEAYDPGCRITSRQMKLQPVQVASLGSCRGNECAGLLVLIGATAAASAVISGSIVVVGNIVYWFEKQGLCKKEN